MLKTNIWFLLVLAFLSWTLSVSWLPPPRCSSNSWETNKKNSIQSVGSFFSKHSEHKTKQDNGLQQQEIHGNCEISWIWTFPTPPCWKTQRVKWGNQDYFEWGWSTFPNWRKSCTSPSWNRYTSELIAPDTNNTTWGLTPAKEHSLFSVS